MFRTVVAPATVTFTNTVGNDYTVEDLTANTETISAETGGINVTGAGDVALNVKITGNTNITHSGTGTLSLGGGVVNNDFVGTITVDGGGTLRNLRNQDDIRSLGDDSNTFSFTNGSTFDLNSISTHDDYQHYGTGSFTFGDGTTLTNSSASTANDAFGDQLVFDGDVTLDGVGRFDIQDTITVTESNIVITMENDTGNVIQGDNSAQSISEWIVNDGILFTNLGTSGLGSSATVTVNAEGTLTGNTGSGTDNGSGLGITDIGNAITLNGGKLSSNQANTTTIYSGTITVTADSGIDPNDGSRVVILSGTVAESGSGGNLNIGNGTTRIASTLNATGFTGDFVFNEAGNIELENGVNFAKDTVIDDVGGNKQFRLLAGNSAEISGNITVNDTTVEEFDLNVVDALDTLTVSGDISGTGAAGVTKTSAGSLILSGTNTYTGNTFIYNGVVTVSSGARLSFYPTTDGTTNLADGNATGTLDLDGEIYLDLSGTDTTGGNSWLLVDGSTMTVTYDAVSFSVGSSLAGTFTESADVWTLVDGDNTWTFTEATGILSLETTFSAWAAANSATNDPAANDDADSLVNLLEFAFGTDPNTSDASALTVVGGTFTAGTPAVDTTFSPLTVKARFIRLVDHANSGITYTAQFSNDLSFWQDVDGSSGVRIGTTGAQGDYEAVEVDYPLFLNNGKKAQFFRLSINDVDADSVSP